MQPNANSTDAPTRAGIACLVVFLLPFLLFGGVAVQIGVRELMRRSATLRADRSGLLYHRTWLGHGGPTTISADQIKSVVANPTSNSDYYQVDIIRPDDGKTNIAHYIADRRDAEMLAARIQHAINPQA